MGRIVLAVVGILYLILGMWCAIAPTKTSQFVGFNLMPGGGQSEYFTVYGGFEVALGIILLVPFLKPETTATILLVGLILHATLVVFRSISLVLYSGIPGSTWGLAAAEWVLLIAFAAAWWNHTEA